MKYEPLGVFLKSRSASHVPITIAEIEDVIGGKLPNSAHRYRPWWSNNASNSVMTKVWLDAGFVTEQVDMQGKKLVFRRVAKAAPPTGGMADTPREFASAGDVEKKPRRSPLFGALKGTFILVPPGESELPPEDPESWEALSLAKLDRLLFGKGN